jgi:hypothetical protein
MAAWPEVSRAFPFREQCAALVCWGRILIRLNPACARIRSLPLPVLLFSGHAGLSEDLNGTTLKGGAHMQSGASGGGPWDGGQLVNSSSGAPLGPH